MEGGGPIGKGWMARGTGMEEVRQGRRKEEGVGPSNEAKSRWGVPRVT